MEKPDTSGRGRGRGLGLGLGLGHGHGLGHGRGHGQENDSMERVVTFVCTALRGQCSIPR